MNLGKRDLTFLMVGILMLIIVLIYLGWAISFLVKEVNLAINRDSAISQPALNFEIEKAGLLYKKASGQ